MFEELNFSFDQINKYYQSAAKDLRLAASAGAPELAFYACYNVNSCNNTILKYN